MDKQQPRWSAKHAALVVLLLAAIVVAFGQHAGLAQDPGSPNEQRPSPPGVTEAEADVSAQAVGPYYTTVPAGAFSSDGYDPDGFSKDMGCFWGLVNVGACLLAPVYAPIGATINGLEVFLEDDNATYYSYFYLTRSNLSTGYIEEMAYVSGPVGTTAGVTRLSDYTIAYPLVTKSYLYNLYACARTNIYVYGARIGYSLGAGSAAGEEEVDLPIVVNDD